MQAPATGPAQTGFLIYARSPPERYPAGFTIQSNPKRGTAYFQSMRRFVA